MKSTRRQPRKGRSAKALSGKSYYLNMECIQQLEHIKVTNQWDILNIACYAAGNNSLLCTGYPNTSIYAKNGGSKALPDANIHQIWWVFGNTSCLQAARAPKIEMNRIHRAMYRFSTYTLIKQYNQYNMRCITCRWHDHAQKALDWSAGKTIAVNAPIYICIISMAEVLKESVSQVSYSIEIRPDANATGLLGNTIRSPQQHGLHSPKHR